MSCLKTFDFTTFTTDEIINKYEEVLEGRENQVTDLSLELGKTQEKLESYEEKIKILEEENAKLHALLKKKDFFLNEELKSKEIIFMRLQDKENECDELKLKLQQSHKPEKQSQGKVGALVGYLFGSSSTTIPVKESREEKNCATISSITPSNSIQANTINTSITPVTQIIPEESEKVTDIVSKSTKSLDKIKQLKDKKKKKTDEETK